MVRAGEPSVEEAEPSAESGATEAAGSSTESESSIAAQRRAQQRAEAERATREEPTEEKRVPWIKRWAPVRHMVGVGVFGGVFVPSDKHDFYDPATAPQTPLWALGGDIGAHVHYFPLRFLGVELEFAAMPTFARSATNDFVFLWAFRGHLVAQLPYWSVTPFLLVGPGMMGVSSDADAVGKDIDPTMHWGGGLKIFTSKWLAVRLEGRHVLGAHAARQNDVTSHGEVLLALDVTIRPKPKPKPPPPPPDPDRDKDGFINEVDACPDTPGVKPDGCPAKDSDKDGFFDHVDKCPKEPGVAPDGCPIPDTDGDGILDPDDQCVNEPETKNGFEDKDGCPDELPEPVKEFSGVIEGIEFDFNKATIRPVSRPVLDKAVKVLQEYPEIRLEIVGHTDNVGSEEFNTRLSRERADAVREYLIKGGVEESRLQTRGAGPTEPIAPNDSEAGRAKNRRVEFKLLSP